MENQRKKLESRKFFEKKLGDREASREKNFATKKLKPRELRRASPPPLARPTTSPPPEPPRRASPPHPGRRIRQRRRRSADPAARGGGSGGTRVGGAQIRRRAAAGSSDPVAALRGMALSSQIRRGRSWRGAGDGGGTAAPAGWRGTGGRGGAAAPAGWRGAGGGKRIGRRGRERDKEGKKEERGESL